MLHPGVPDKMEASHCVQSKSGTLLSPTCLVLQIPYHILGGHPCRKNRPFKKKRTKDKEGKKEGEKRKKKLAKAKQSWHCLTPILPCCPGRSTTPYFLASSRSTLTGITGCKGTFPNSLG